MTITELEQAVTKLSEKDLAMFREWFEEYDAEECGQANRARRQSGKIG